ncbi:hypothetical protein IM660_01450 [Ruania alkalisoli]|uniref:SDR-like Ig domain-containing protein n=1 Tax=Ruania alkalisoli TaxID=2779775 RepID=A0A7M1STV7_9MICO|nr:hypothetical protein [Ruania alkalisoli]QOR71010.1 hypothetical protein IM660_01450 [Ruania alkalisoli]
MPRNRALVAAGLALLVLLLAVPAVAPQALTAWARPGTTNDSHAEPVTWSVTVDEAATSRWGTFDVALTWTDPAASTRDGFVLDLPAELVPLTDTFDVRAATGQVVARAAVDDGALTLTYTDHALGTLTGTATFVAGWDDGPSPGEDITLTFSAVGTTVDVAISLDAEDEDSPGPRLYGYWRDRAIEDTASPEAALQWRVVTGRGPVRDTVIDTELGDGHRLDCTGITGRLQTAFEANGDASAAHDLPAGALDVVSCDGSGFTVDLPEVEPGTALMVLFSSTVTDPARTDYSTSAGFAPGSRDLNSTIERATSIGTGSVAVSEPTAGASQPRAFLQSPGWLWLPLALLALGGSTLLYRLARRR